MAALADTYLKAKRYLTFFSAIQLLGCFVGLRAASESAFLGVTVAQPQYLTTITFVVVLYYLFQLRLFWEAQTEPIRQRPQHALDYQASIIIAVISLVAVPTTMLMQLTGIHVLPAATPPHWGQVIALYAALLAALLAGAPLIESVGKQRLKLIEEQNAALVALTNNTWRFVFSPITYKNTRGKEGSKKMRFLPGGEIVEGQNDNEYKWRASGPFVELLNNEGRVYSRFTYDQTKDRFVHTNDEDTLSVRGQYMELESAG